MSSVQQNHRPSSPASYPSYAPPPSGKRFLYDYDNEDDYDDDASPEDSAGEKYPGTTASLGNQPGHTPPPPPYSPPKGFVSTGPGPPPILMSAHPSSVITQVHEDQYHPYGYLGEYEAPTGDIHLDLRGTMFTIPREELLRLPESILLGISNGLMFDADGAISVNLAQASTATVNFSPDCLQYTLDVFRRAAQDVSPQMLALDPGAPPADDLSLPGAAQPHGYGGDQHEEEPTGQPGPHPEHPVPEAQQQGPHTADPTSVPAPVAPPGGDLIVSITDVLKKRPAIIVLREDLDYYCVPTDPGLDAERMREIKLMTGDMLVNQNKIFAGLRKSSDSGSPEHHLIEMLCSSGFSLDDRWGFRDREPNKTVISSLVLTRLRKTDFSLPPEPPAVPASRARRQSVPPRHASVGGGHGRSRSMPGIPDDVLEDVRQMMEMENASHKEKHGNHDASGDAKNSSSAIHPDPEHPAPHQDAHSDAHSNAPSDAPSESPSDFTTPHKLLLFWRKPARKCWWDSITVNDFPGLKNPMRIHVRRVWTLELSVIGVR